MSDEFVETGQTFTEDGAAFCPVERRQRNALGVFVSLGVLFAGAGFLAFAVFATPDRANTVAALEPDPAQSETVEGQPLIPLPEFEAQATDASEVDLAATADETIALETPEPRKAPQPAAPDGDEIEAALAQSRAARAAASPTPYQFAAPRLKPENATTVQPSLSPLEISPLQSPRPVIADGSPPPAKFNLATEHLHVDRAPALAYVGDVGPEAAQQKIIVSRGETFVDALKKAGVASLDRHEAALALREHYNLRRLRPGQEFSLTIGWPNQTLFQLASMGEEEARLLKLQFRDGFTSLITVARAPEGGFDATKAEIPLTTRLHAIEGEIDGSLYLSAKSLGAPDDVIAGLADTFAYDVDFQREIFAGDEFEMLFEANYDDRGQMAPGGEIIYARLNWRGLSREKGYYRFEEEPGSGRADFYDASGQSAKRLLMKTPIDGARLSSRFGTRRHPILGYARAHKGVDFAAPRGTPIKAAGDGVIERADRYGSFGNYMRIRHANGYKTAYAHLNGFARGMRKGKRVRQGDIIGYVGTTGRSTGPHLHYEVHLNGTPVNPQRLKIETGKKLTGAMLDRFRRERDRIDALLSAQAEPPLLTAEKEEASEQL
ncbi:MAG: peptidoglycan DD-metalloendopeptidase family protein [Pseudomonadota bacterium]